MKKSTAALLCVATLMTAPAYASNLADPIIAPEVVVADTTESSGDLDALMIAIYSVLFIMAAAGAF